MYIKYLGLPKKYVTFALEGLWHISAKPWVHSCAPNSGDNAPPRFCRGNKLHCAIERFSPYIHVEIYIYWHFQYRETTFCATYFISSLQSSLPTLLKLIYLRILKKKHFNLSEKPDGIWIHFWIHAIWVFQTTKSTLHTSKWGYFAQRYQTLKVLLHSWLDHWLLYTWIHIIFFENPHNFWMV